MVLCVSLNYLMKKRCNCPETYSLFDHYTFVSRTFIGLHNNYCGFRQNWKENNVWKNGVNVSLYNCVEIKKGISPCYI